MEQWSYGKAIVSWKAMTLVHLEMCVQQFLTLAMAPAQFSVCEKWQWNSNGVVGVAI